MREWSVRTYLILYIFYDNTNYVNFYLDFLGIPPSFKNVVPSINCTKNMSPGVGKACGE